MAKYLTGEELNNYLDDITAAGMAVTNEWKEMWQTAIEYAWGKQLKGIRLNKNWDYVVVNQIYPMLFQTIAKLTRNHPKILTEAWAEENYDYVERWAGLLQYLWEQELRMRPKLIRGLLTCGLFGYMIGKVTWEEKAKWNEQKCQWVGEVQHRWVHPSLFWCDTNAATLDEADYCGTRRTVRLSWAVKRWPKFAKQLTAESYLASDSAGAGQPIRMASLLNNDESYESEIDYNTGGFFSQLVGLIFGNKRGDTCEAVDTSERFVDVEEIYFRDHSERKRQVMGKVPAERLVAQDVIYADAIDNKYKGVSDGQEVTQWPEEVIDEYDEPIFPNGRVILRVGKTILNASEEEQVYPYSRWPFVIMPWHLLPFMWQGGNAVEMARSAQDTLNMTISHMVHHVKMHANPTKIVEQGALARDRQGKIRKITGRIGEMIVVARGRRDGIKTESPPAMSSSVLALAQTMHQNLQDVMFMQDIARGATTDRGMSATEAARLDSNSHNYVGMQAEMLDMFIEHTAQLMAEVVQNNYTEDRVVRIIGTNGEKQIVSLTDKMLSAAFDVNIETGSTMPFDEEKRKNDYMMAYKLFADPIENPMLEDMLRVLNIANRNKLLTKHQGRKIFMQFLQMSTQISQIPPQELPKILPNVLPQVLQLMKQAAMLAGKGSGTDAVPSKQVPADGA